MAAWHPLARRGAGDAGGARRSSARSRCRSTRRSRAPRPARRSTSSRRRARGAARARDRRRPALPRRRRISCAPSSNGSRRRSRTLPPEHAATAPVLFSAHGLPEVYIRKGDPYLDDIRITVEAVSRAHGARRARAPLLPEQGRAQALARPLHRGRCSTSWRRPVTRAVVVVPIAFTGEHIETLQEIDILYRERAEKAGIVHFARARTVGTPPRRSSPRWRIWRSAPPANAAGSSPPCAIAVIGGGISGLTAAHLLVARGHDVGAGRRRGRAGRPHRQRARRRISLRARAAGGARRVRSVSRRSSPAPVSRPASSAPSPASRRRSVYVAGKLRPFPCQPAARCSRRTSSARAASCASCASRSFRAAGGAEDDDEIGVRLRGAPVRDGGGRARRRARAHRRLRRRRGRALDARGVAAARRARARARQRPARAVPRRAGRAGSVGPSRSPTASASCRARWPRRSGRDGGRRARRGSSRAPTAGRWRSTRGRARSRPSGSSWRRRPPRPPRCWRRTQPDAAAALRAIPHAPVAVVCLGLSRRRRGRLGMDLDAYGFVVARGEGICPARLPVRLVGLPRARARGRRAPARALRRDVRSGAGRQPTTTRSPDRRSAISRRAAGLRREPDVVQVWRARPGIPQYDRAQLARVRAIDDAVARLPGLSVIGHALRGVGVSACIRRRDRARS